MKSSSSFKLSRKSRKGKVFGLGLINLNHFLLFLFLSLLKMFRTSKEHLAVGSFKAYREILFAKVLLGILKTRFWEGISKEIDHKIALWSVRDGKTWSQFPWRAEPWRIKSRTDSPLVGLLGRANCKWNCLESSNKSLDFGVLRNVNIKVTKKKNKLPFLWWNISTDTRE